MDQVI